MVRTGIFVIGILLAIATVQSTSKAQAVEQGTIIIDPYYGFPPAGKAMLEEIFNPITMTVSGIEPAGARVEYLLTNRFGVGIDFSSKQMVGEFTKLDSVSGKVLNYEGTVSRTRVHLRLNYHLMASTEVMDVYVALGTGTNSRNITLSSQEDLNGNLTWNEVPIIPISARFGLGLRYYFTKNIGINAEIGIGGPLVTGGVSLKF